MKTSLVTLLAALMTFTAISQYLAVRRSGQSVDRKNVLVLLNQLMTVFSLLSALPFSEGCGLVLIACLLPSLSCMSFQTSSLYDSSAPWQWTAVAIAFNAALVLLHVVSMIINVRSTGGDVYLAAICLIVLMQFSFYLTGLFSRVRKVKKVMKAGTVWANVGLGIDALYMSFEMIVLVLYLGISAMAGRYDGVHGVLAFFFLGLEMVAYGYRVRTDSVFVLWRRQEQRIIEAMKVTQVESASDVSRIDKVYKEIYERVVAYFEREKPFLDCELTINDLVKVLYSNKLYISRAISQFTGRNFCQFVNYYRIQYSTECFKSNHELKIHEMASMSGFNSIVSFNMAFRLYMGENPSDWCRKEKGRHVKGEK